MPGRRTVLARDLMRRQQRAELTARLTHARTRLQPSVLLAGWKQAQVRRAKDAAEAAIAVAGRNKGPLAGGVAAAVAGLGLWHWLTRRRDGRSDPGYDEQ